MKNGNENGKGKKVFEKVSKIQIIFPVMGTDYYTNDKVKHDIEMACRNILQEIFSNEDLVGHNHSEKKSYWIYTNKEMENYERISLKAYEKLLENGLNPTTEDIKENIREDIHYMGRHIDDILKGIIELRENESMICYMDFFPYTAPKEAVNGVFYNGYMALTLHYERKFGSNPNNRLNKVSYKNRLLKLKNELATIFKGKVKLYLTVSECSYREVSDTHNCTETEMDIPID